MSELELLKDALELYNQKWSSEKDMTDNRDVKIQKTALCFLSRWIINSINGGLDVPHSTNICNILRDKED
jgi:hypothetical protein